MRLKVLRFVLIAAPLLTANAEVFMRLSRSPERILSNLGGSKVYQSSVRVNGSKGELSSFIFNQRSEVTAKLLAKKLKLPKPRTASAVILDATKKGLTRYFIIQAPGLQDCSLVTALEQKSSIFKRPSSGPPPWPTEIPVLNASAQFTARCEKTRTTFLCAVSNSSTPEQAVTDASAILAGEGWAEMPPTTPTFRIFTKGVKQRVIFADENTTTREVNINILQRDGVKR